MSPTIVAEGAASLAEYASISIAFETAECVDVDVLRTGDLQTRAMREPLGKNYDDYPDNHPLDWPKHFDVEHWTFLAAYRSGARVGGAVVFAGESSVHPLEERRDLAILWDLRVAPEARRTGIGSALVSIAQAWAWANAYSELRVETQDVNVDACRLYARHGFQLQAANRGAYPDLPEEIQLFWSVQLAGMPD